MRGLRTWRLPSAGGMCGLLTNRELKNCGPHSLSPLGGMPSLAVRARVTIVQLMPLSAGTRLGPYEILSPLGAGGMGEVYRARDTRLDRTIAIKILPSHLSENPEARQRFDREARAISSLNHPNICTLHDVGHEDGIDYLVME